MSILDGTGFYKLTELPVKNKDNNSQLEIAARQLVLGPISPARAARHDWSRWADVNAFEALVKEGLALKDYDGNFIASEVLKTRYTEVCAARITFDAAAEKLGVKLPTKPWAATLIKHAGPKTKGSIDTLKEFIEEDDIENADQYATNIGQPLVFGTGPRGKRANVYIQGEPLEIEGQPFFVAKSHHKTRPAWFVISKDTGQSLVGGAEVLTSKAAALAAVKVALDQIAKHGRTLAWCCNNAPQISQAELRSTHINHPEGVTP
jgi:hypothetical protein